MSIHYNISPELNMIIYICEGEVTGSEILKVADTAYLDKRRKHGMISISDFLFADVDFELGDLKRFLLWTNNMKSTGFEPEQVIMLTQDKGLALTCTTINLLANVPSYVSSFFSIEEMISALNLPEIKSQVIRFWEESKRLTG